MRKRTLVNDFVNISVPNKIVFGRNAVIRMMLISLFSDPDISYEILTALLNKLESLYMASRSGDHEQVALMHQAELEFDNAFRKLGNYVERVADGDEATILSSGFHLSKPQAPSDRSDFIVEAGDTPGKMKCKCKAVAGSRAYVWQYYIGEDTPTENQWLLAGSSTQASFEQDGLPSGMRGHFRVAAVTKDGIQPFSDPIMKIIP